MKSVARQKFKFGDAKLTFFGTNTSLTSFIEVAVNQERIAK